MQIYARIPKGWSAAGDIGYCPTSGPLGIVVAGADKISERQLGKSEQSARIGERGRPRQGNNTELEGTG